MVNLGHLYGLMSKNDDELQVYQEALQEVRGDIVHASTPQLRIHLSNILSGMSQMYLSQYDSQITNGAMGDKDKCNGAKALPEEALSIQRALLEQELARVHYKRTRATSCSNTISSTLATLSLPPSTHSRDITAPFFEMLLHRRCVHSCLCSRMWAC